MALSELSLGKNRFIFLPYENSVKLKLQQD